MKAYLNEFVYGVSIFMFILLGFFPPVAKAGACLPQEGGGTGNFFTTVHYPDQKAVVFSWYCQDGLGYSLIAKDEVKEVISKRAKMSPIEFEHEWIRVRRLESATEGLEKLQVLAKRQILTYAPSMATRKKKALDKVRI